MRAANSSARPFEHVADAEVSPASANRSPIRQSSNASLRHDRPEARRLKAARLATPKILLYSHDTFGLGNIRRTLLLAEELSAQYTGAAILMVTGSQMVHSFRIPDGVDYIKRGMWPVDKNYSVGYAAFPGLTLLECGASPKDPAVQHYADFVRRWADAVSAEHASSLEREPGDAPHGLLDGDPVSELGLATQ